MPRFETPVELPSDPSEDLQAATKQYVDGQASGGGGGNAGFAETIGDGTNTSYQVTHNLDSTDLVVQLWDLTGAEPVEATGDASQIEVDDTDSITVTFGSAPAADSYRVVILVPGGRGFGPLQAFAPTFAAHLGGASLGNGSINAWYAESVDMVWYFGEMTWGSTTDNGSGILTFTLPEPAHVSSPQIEYTGTGFIQEVGVAQYAVTSWIEQALGVLRFRVNAVMSHSGTVYVTSANVTNAVPISLGNGDSLSWSILYAKEVP